MQKAHIGLKRNEKLQQGSVCAKFAQVKLKQLRARTKPDVNAMKLVQIFLSPTLSELGHINSFQKGNGLKGGCDSSRLILSATTEDYSVVQRETKSRMARRKKPGNRRPREKSP